MKQIQIVDNTQDDFTLELEAVFTAMATHINELQRAMGRQAFNFADASAEDMTWQGINDGIRVAYNRALDDHQAFVRKALKMKQNSHEYAGPLDAKQQQILDYYNQSSRQSKKLADKWSNLQYKMVKVKGLRETYPDE